MSLTSTEHSTINFDQSLLKQLVPIRDLQPEDRQQLAVKSHVIDMLPGQALDAADEHRWILYLLEGKIELIERDQQPLMVLSNEVRAYHPLFTEKSHKLRAVAETHCKIIRFDRQLFSTLLEQELISGEQLETIEIGDVASNIFNVIVQAFNAGQLKLPSLPEIAVKIKTAVSNPNVSIRDVSRIVEADPAMVARLIQVANSPISRGIDPVKSIHDAIVRLGLATTRNLVMSLSVKQLFKTKDKMLNERMHDLYDHSVEVAAISYAIANKSGKLPADQMLLAGLIHDIGVIPVLTYIDETGLQVTNSEELEHIIKNLRTVVGSMVIKQWGFSSELVTLVEEAENWQRDSGEQLDTCDVVIMAQIYYMLQKHMVKDLPKIDDVPAFQKLFDGKNDPEFVMHVLDDAHEEINEVMRLLKM